MKTAVIMIPISKKKHALVQINADEWIEGFGMLCFKTNGEIVAFVNLVNGVIMDFGKEHIEFLADKEAK